MEIATALAPNWIYDFSDYQQMYDMIEADFSKSILDFSAGISSFNSDATKKDWHVVSADLSYALPEAKMREHAQALLQQTILALKANPNRLRNPTPDTMEKVIQLWTETESHFLEDYVLGKTQSRYQAISSLKLPYQTHQFQLALCTNFLFHQPISREQASLILKELCRVAEEVRIFPLLDNHGKMTDELGPLMLSFHQKNYGVEVRQVDYHTLKGGNAMLRVWEQECQI